MDARTFDRLTTAAARRPTRRAALRLLAGSLVAGLLARRGASSADAAQIDMIDPTSSDLLCAVQGLADCGGFCADVSADPYNCGACGRVCAAGDTCSGGACVAGAVSDIVLNDVSICAVQGLTECGGFCTNTLNDSHNCGICGNSCPLGAYCEGGVCLGGPCPGLTNCSGVCVNVNYDSYHCGACGTVCPYPTVCCSGRCVDLSSDWGHCGACEFGCFAGATCVNGTCI
jgi:hypothetical protein